MGQSPRKRKQWCGYRSALQCNGGRTTIGAMQGVPSLWLTCSACLLLLVAAACSGTATPRAYEAAACQFEIPQGQTVECGYLTVPEDRSQSDGPTIRLHVAIFRTQSNDPAPHPIVYLAGGPGQDALEGVPLTFNRLIAPFLANRDFIMFDQRGTGFSKPALDCPEYVDLSYATLNQDLKSGQWEALTTEAFLACRDRLVREGINLAAYTSAENGADVNDLRQALGYDEWNLLGISYGTKLALTTMRDFPEGIRSVILDSTYPLQVDLYTALPSNADRAFTVLFDGCAADPTCNAAFPQLETAFFQLVEGLNETHVSHPITHPLTGQSFEALLNGDGLIGILFDSLYDTSIIPLLPRIISGARNGNYTALALIQGALLIDLDHSSIGMHFSVQCGEEMHFTTLEEIAAASKAYPQLRNNFGSTADFKICQFWGARKADPIENQPVSSDIPTLVLAGEYDPITPPLWGQLAAENLSSSFSFEFPGVGHGVSTSGACPLQITRAFLDNPTVKPDASCIAQMGR